MNDLYLRLRPLRDGDRSFNTCRIRELLIYELREKHNYTYQAIGNLLQRTPSTIYKLYLNYLHYSKLYKDYYSQYEDTKNKYINVITDVSTHN